MRDKTVRLSHGSGRGLDELLSTVIVPALIDPAWRLQPEDAAVIDPPLPGSRLAFTTDSFVVSPLQFSGGDIGKLAACGTINDLAMMGGRPRQMSVALIIEEGLALDVLSTVLSSLRAVCREAGVAVVCGDTKVVDKGKGDGLFINTSGIGVIPQGRMLSVGNARQGDVVLVSGPIGRHGVAILAGRKNLNFASTVVSDCAPLNGIVEHLLGRVPGVRLLRDATRGGVAAVLNEIARASNAGVVVDQEQVPVPQEVSGACGYLGLDPLQVANEGTFVAVVARDEAPDALAALQEHELGRGAAIVGEVIEKNHFPVMLKTGIGGMRSVEMPPGELLPRIC